MPPRSLAARAGTLPPGFPVGERHHEKAPDGADPPGIRAAGRPAFPCRTSSSWLLRWRTSPERGGPRLPSPLGGGKRPPLGGLSALLPPGGGLRVLRRPGGEDLGHAVVAAVSCCAGPDQVRVVLVAAAPAAEVAAEAVPRVPVAAERAGGGVPPARHRHRQHALLVSEARQALLDPARPPGGECAPAGSRLSSPLPPLDTAQVLERDRAQPLPGKAQGRLADQLALIRRLLKTLDGFSDKP